MASFNSDLAEELWNKSMSSFEDDALGDQDTFGWYGLFREEMVILSADSQGFVEAAQYDDETVLEADWRTLQDAWDTFDSE